jgi:hypothetical protein
MNELSKPAKSVLMAAATLMIGFSTLHACRGNDFKLTSKMLARGDTSLAYSALTYITWPRESFETDSSPFVIGVVGKTSDVHERLLADYGGGKKKIHGRSVDVRRFANGAEITTCHVLLVPQSCPREQVAQVLKAVRGKSTLTLGETGEFVSGGGVLSVVKNGDDRILELNPIAAKRQQLKVDVRLVNVSVVVREP